MPGTQAICPIDASEGLGALNLSAVTMDQIINMFYTYITNSEELYQQFNTYISNTELAQLSDVDDDLGDAPVGSFFVKGPNGLWTWTDAPYILEPATYTTLGGVIIGDGLSVDETGLLSLAYDLPIATYESLGGIIVGNGLLVDETGLLQLNLPIATYSTLGGVIIGEGLVVDENGLISVQFSDPYELPIATEIILGGVKIGSNISITEDGVISVVFPNGYELPIATSETLGGIKVGSGLSIDITGVLSTDISNSFSDNILKWNGDSTFTAYDGKLESDPGYAYFYVSEATPTYDNTVMLDGNLVSSSLFTYEADAEYMSGVTPSAVYITKNIDPELTLAMLVTDTGIGISSFGQSGSEKIYIGDFTGGYNGENISIDDANRIFTINFTDINLAKGVANKWLALDGDNNITYKDAPDSTYVHPTQAIISPTLTGAKVLNSLYVNELGHVTSATTRTLTLADLGYVAPTGNYIYAIDSSNINSVPVFNDITGNIVRESNVYINGSGQMNLDSSDTFAVDALGALHAIHGYTFSPSGIGLIAQSPYVPISSINSNTDPDIIRNCLTLDTDSENITLVNNGFGTSIDWAMAHNRISKDPLSIIAHRELVKYTDSTESIEDSMKEWWLLNNGVLTKNMWLDEAGNLFITGYFNSAGGGGSVTSISTTGAITGGNPDPITNIGTIGHLETDGYLHVPPTLYSNAGKVLTAGSAPGVISWEPLDSSAGGNHQQIYSDSLQAGTNAEYLMKDMTATFIPKSNSLLVLFYSTITTVANSQPVYCYINAEQGTRTDKKPSYQLIFTHSNVTSFHHLVEDVVPGQEITISVTWNTTDAVRSTYRNLIIVDLPVSLGGPTAGGTVTEIYTEGAITGGTITTTGTIGHRTDDGYLHVPANPEGVYDGKFLMAGANAGDLSWETVTGGVGAMEWPAAAGIAVYGGSSAWGTSIIDNSENWNTAYSWGDHAGLYSLLDHVQDVTHGGTGLIELGDPGYSLRVNAEGTEYEWYLPGTGGGGIGGSGTLGYLPKWLVGGSSLGDSPVYTDGTNVGIGIAASLTHKLDIIGAIRIKDGTGALNGGLIVGPGIFGNPTGGAIWPTQNGFTPSGTNYAFATSTLGIVKLNMPSGGYGITMNLSDNSYFGMLGNGGVFVGNGFSGNDAGAGKLIVQNALGIGVSSPSAKLNIAPSNGSVGSAPIKLAPGLLLSVKEDGVFEYASSHIYFTIGSTRYQLDQQGGGGGTGTVTSIGMTVPTGLLVSPSAITDSGTFAITYDTASGGYSIPLNSKQSNWDTAYNDRFKWDGGSTGLVPATGRTSLGATTVGTGFFTSTSPNAITYPRVNANNTVTYLTGAQLVDELGVSGGGSGITSINMSTALLPAVTVTPTLINSSGQTFALSATSGYYFPTTTDKTNWDKYNQWDGGATGLTASTGRTSLGATTVGSNFFTLANPGSIRFPRVNSDNTVSLLSSIDMLAAIYASGYITAGDGLVNSGTTVSPVLDIKSHLGSVGIGTLYISADSIGVNLGTTSSTAASGDHIQDIYHGGTGLTSLGSSGQSIRSNGTSYEWYTPTTGGTVTVTDGMLDLDITSDVLTVSPFSTKKLSDPGYAYMYLGDSYPSYQRRLNLDGDLYGHGLHAYLSATTGVSIFGSGEVRLKDAGNTLSISTGSVVSTISASNGGVYSKIYIGNTLGEYVLSDLANNLLELNMTNIKLPKLLASKYLALDASKNIIAVDGPAAGGIPGAGVPISNGTSWGTSIPISGIDIRAINYTITAQNFILSSDRAKKTNIFDIGTSELDINYKEYEFLSSVGEKRYGVIAQDIEDKYPELVVVNNGEYSVKYIDLLVREVAYLKEEVKKLKGL